VKEDQPVLVKTYAAHAKESSLKIATVKAETCKSTNQQISVVQQVGVEFYITKFTMFV